MVWKEGFEWGKTVCGESIERCLLGKVEKNNFKQQKGFLSNQEGYVWCEPEDPDVESGWYKIDIGHYVSAEERNKQYSKPCGRPQLQKGMYHFTMVDKTNDSDEWSDYFSDYDETVGVNGKQGDDLWGSR